MRYTNELPSVSHKLATLWMGSFRSRQAHDRREVQCWCNCGAIICWDRSQTCQHHTSRHSQPLCAGYLAPMQIPYEQRASDQSAPSNFVCVKSTRNAGRMPRSARSIIVPPSAPNHKGRRGRRSLCASVAMDARSLRNSARAHPSRRSSICAASEGGTLRATCRVMSHSWGARDAPPSVPPSVATHPPPPSSHPPPSSLPLPPPPPPPPRKPPAPGASSTSGSSSAAVACKRWPFDNERCRATCAHTSSTASAS
jgi:hypothetical protein